MKVYTCESSSVSHVMVFLVREVAALLLLAVDAHLVRVVRVQDEGVHVRELVGFACDGLLGQRGRRPPSSCRRCAPRTCCPGAG